MADPERRWLLPALALTLGLSCGALFWEAAPQRYSPSELGALQLLMGAALPWSIVAAIDILGRLSNAVVIGIGIGLNAWFIGRSIARGIPKGALRAAALVYLPYIAGGFAMAVLGVFPSLKGHTPPSFHAIATASSLAGLVAGWPSLPARPLRVPALVAYLVLSHLLLAWFGLSLGCGYFDICS